MISKFQGRNIVTGWAQETLNHNLLMIIINKQKKNMRQVFDKSDYNL